MEQLAAARGESGHQVKGMWQARPGGIPDKYNKTPQVLSSPIERQRLRTACSLLTVSFAGAIDDSAVQISLLLSRASSPGQLSSGVLLGSIVVVAVSMGIARCRCIARVAESIQLWTLIGSFAVFTFFDVF